MSGFSRLAGFAACTRRRWSIFFVLVILPVSLLACDSQPESINPGRASDIPATSWPASFDIGRKATRSEIVAWDIDVNPDGQGLPEGSGTATSGAKTYASKCAACHGADGEGGVADRLVGREVGADFPFGRSYSSLSKKTIGTYWPYASTLFDYTNRAMPQDAPGSLTSDEVYGVVAFLLFKNDIISGDFVVNADTLHLVEMPARNRFVEDDRHGSSEVR